MPDLETASILKRFWSKVAIGDPDDCWLWLAAKNRGGYGNFWRMWSKDKRLDKVGDLYSLKADPSGQLFKSRDDDAPPQEAAAV